MKSDTKIQRWETVSSRTVFEAKHWFRVVQDTVKLPGGRVVDDYFRIEAQEYVLIYAKSIDGKVLVERQYKHGLGKITTTFPAGFVDKGETPLEAAKRELLEETGFRAKTWKHMGTYVLDGTRDSGTAHYFIAEDLERTAEPVQSDIEEMEVSFLSSDELLKAVGEGDICLLPAIAIMAMATNPLLENLFTIVEKAK